MAAKRRKYHPNKVATIVGPGTSVDGRIQSTGSIRIEGSVTGRVECDDTIVVHAGGVVTADLEAGQIIVSGTVEGNCSAVDRIEITRTGIVRGDITAPRIAIAEGVVFEGRCTMNPNAEATTPAKRAARGERSEQGPASSALSGPANSAS